MKDHKNFDAITPSARIWESEVPIIIDQANNAVTAYLTGQISEPNHYNELCHMLNNADESTSFTIHLNTPGGIIDSAFMIAASIKKSQAHVNAELSGTVASAGTIICMACDDISVSDHLTFMIHNYSGGMAGKGHEMKARQKFLDEHLNKAFKSFYDGFLNSEEMDRVIEGTDMWMSTEEVCERWKTRKSNSLSYNKHAA